MAKKQTSNNNGKSSGKNSPSKNKTNTKPTAKKPLRKKEETNLAVSHPDFPFWARLKINKNRTTLVIDEDIGFDKHKKEKIPVFINREATHDKEGQKNFEEIKPNPDKTDKRPMYLKRPQKKDKKLFKPHNKKLEMPKHLKKRYEKNNDKNKK